VQEKRIVFHGHSFDEHLAAKNSTLLDTARHRIFLLSPANASGIRAKRLLRADARSELAQRLRGAGAPLGEVYRFISSLYFRGKLAYAEQFQNPPDGADGIYIITASAGLMSPSANVTLRDLQSISSAAVDVANREYREPLDRDLLQLRSRIDLQTEIVLLGSVATPKYVEPLLASFSDRLFFPRDFAGRGDMSRGGLLLRCVSSGSELIYVPVGSSRRNGERPPKLPKLSRGPKRVSVGLT
jgi:hypothetical protein